MYFKVNLFGYAYKKQKAYWLFKIGIAFASWMNLERIYSFKKNDFLYFGLCKIFVSVQAFSPVVASGGCACCEAWASVAAAPGSGAQARQSWRVGFAALWHVGFSWTRGWTHVFCIGRWVLYHLHWQVSSLWATREVSKTISRWHGVLQPLNIAHFPVYLGFYFFLLKCSVIFIWFAFQHFTFFDAIWK